VQATLSRAGTSMVLAVALLTALITSDAVLVTRQAAPPIRVVSGDPTELPDPNTRDVPRGLSQGWIPLGRKRINVPILMYHYIHDLPKKYDQLTFNLTVTPANFNAQLKWLSIHGYHSVTFDDLRAYFAGRHELPSKPFVITLDDGYRDLFTTAYPIIRAYGFVAVAYIVTGFVGHPRYVTTDMIKQMDGDGIEIASHTVDHVDLAKMLLPSIDYEVIQSKRWLEALLGHPVIDFAYPSGKFDPLDETALQAAGYSTAVVEDGLTTDRDWATRYAWRRTRVGGGESLATFIKSLGPIEPYVFAPASV
jgi:peptidoglycan/xylan/chitin deacetylase (PgdA/CDA1 family)